MPPRTGPLSHLSWAAWRGSLTCQALSSEAPCSRGVATTAARTRTQTPLPSSAPTSTDHWLAEVRRYTLHPASATAFLAATSDPAALALRRTLPFVAMWTTEAGGGMRGGISLQTVTHLYAWRSAAERASVRARLAAEPGWAAYLAASRPAVSHQANELLAVPADQAQALLRSIGSARPPPPTPAAVFELRTGLSRARLRAAADHDAAGAALCLAGTVIVGEGVGTGVQLWRHASIESCLAPRLALGGGGGGEDGGQPRRVRDPAARGDRALLRAVAWSPLQ